MTYSSTAVYKYLIYLEHYLTGDLKLFKDLAEQAEVKERAHEAEIASTDSVGTSSSTLTTQTTLSPASFAFNYGNPIISRATIPFTLTLFSTADILGYLTGSGIDFKNTTANLESFFYHPSVGLSSAEFKVLHAVYRNGLPHVYFPKLDAELSYRSTNDPNKLFMKIGDRLILNVNKLEKIVTKRLREIIRDTSLYSAMESKYLHINSKYETEARPMINILKASL